MYDNPGLNQLSHLFLSPDPRKYTLFFVSYKIYIPFSINGGKEPEKYPFIATKQEVVRL